MGRAFYQMCGVFAELVRSNIKENRKAGIAAAKKRGKHLGRPPALRAAQVVFARAEIAGDRQTVAELAEFFQVNRSTINRALAKAA